MLLALVTCSMCTAFVLRSTTTIRDKCINSRLFPGSNTATSLGIGSFQYDQVTKDLNDKATGKGKFRIPFISTKLNAFANGLKYFDSDKESNRKFRRTVFNKHDWKKHRSGNRYFTELLSMPRSVVLRGLTVQAFTVTLFSAVIVAYNLLVEFRSVYLSRKHYFRRYW